MLVPDDKDWTWVIERPCADCGFDAATVDRAELGDAIRGIAATWAEVLRRPDVSQRRRDDRWSDLEYACHVRDVFRVYDARLAQMLAEDGPRYENWDQDATATQERYGTQDPASIAVDLAREAATLAARFDGVDGDQWSRSGFRSDGASFTIDSFARYLLHDLVHHAWDVGA